MNMNKDIIYAVMIKNIVAVISWCTIAVIFNKWWIALFAVLFMSDYHLDNKKYRVCDNCGKHSPYADSYNDALDKAKKAGWIHVVNGNKDYCPDCKQFDNNNM